MKENVWHKYPEELPEDDKLCVAIIKNNNVGCVTTIVNSSLVKEWTENNVWWVYTPEGLNNE